MIFALAKDGANLVAKYIAIITDKPVFNQNLSPRWMGNQVSQLQTCYVGAFESKFDFF